MTALARETVRYSSLAIAEAIYDCPGLIEAMGYAFNSSNILVRDKFQKGLYKTYGINMLKYIFEFFNKQLLEINTSGLGDDKTKAKSIQLGKTLLSVC